MGAGEVAAFKACLFSLSDNGQDCRRDLIVVDAPVSVAQKCPGCSVQGTDHTLRIVLRKPVIQIMDQQCRRFGHHPVVVFGRDS